jgi:hypothetical protein
MNPKTALLTGGLVLLLAGAFGGYLYGANVISTRTTTTASTVSIVPDTYNQIASTYMNQLLLLQDKNTSALANRYEGNATIEWRGLTGGCSGNYTGTKDITQLLSGLRNNTDYLLVSNETQKMTTDGNHWIVNSTFDLSGHGNGQKPFAGYFGATIAAQDSYVHAGNSWLIEREVWNFLRFDGSLLHGPPVVTC